MLTASLDIGNLISKFNRSPQDVLDKSLKDDIFQPGLKLSRNSKTFVWQCLQISPENRMTVLEAGCHDWLCTPERHLEFFQQLDRKILGNWKAPIELKPMPMQLPSVLLSSLVRAQGQEELFKEYSNLSRHYPELQTELSKYFRSSMLRSRSNEVVREGKLPTKAEHPQPREVQATASSSQGVPESSGTGSTRSSRETVVSQKHAFPLGHYKRKHNGVPQGMKRQSVRRRKTKS